MEQETTQQLVAQCIDKGILVTPDMLEDKQKLVTLLQGKERPVTVLKNYDKKARSRSVQDFVKYFNHRYRSLSSILKARQEMASVVSIGRISQKQEREQVTIIGMVMEKRETKNNHMVLMLEDPSGTVEVWLHTNNKQAIEASREIVLDEVIGVVGQISNRRIYASSILFPDIPYTKELKKYPTNVYVAFVGDVEVGSKLFMRKEFENFISWTKGELGDVQQREIAEKTGYVIIIGDLVHGVGIYPGQELDSDIHDIEQQYDAFADLIRQIPERIRVIMITGNHDVVRLQEPQPAVYRDFARKLYELPNVTLLSNPSMVNIAQTDRHPGFDMLLYHGYSIVYYAKEVPIIKDAGGMKALDEVMKFYLRKRHLAPTHGSNTYIPDAEEDPMVIDRVPDFLITGHIHDISHGTYNGVTLINAGCWNNVSDEQIKRGLEPQPAKLPIVNLRTREISVMDFNVK